MFSRKMTVYRFGTTQKSVNNGNFHFWENYSYKDMFWLKYKLSFIDSICQLPLKISLTCTWVYKSKQKNYTEIKVYGATRYKLK